MPVVHTQARIDDSRSNWAFPLVVLASLSIFAQLNFFLDIVISCVFLGVYFRFWRTDDSYLVFGVFLVFLPRLFIFPGGPSLVSVFLLLACVRAVLRKEQMLPNRLLAGGIAFFVYFGFIAIYPAGASITTLASYLLSVMFLMAILPKLSQPQLLRRFLITVSLSSLAGCVYGLFNPNRYIRASSIPGIVEDTASRFTGVDNDPNYMAATLLIGALGSLLIANRVLRASSFAVLVYFVLSTESITAIISLALAIFVLVLMPTRPRSSSSVPALLLLASAIVAAWRPLQSLILNSPLYSSLSDRLGMQTDWITGGSESEIASGRLMIADGYWAYFWQQHPLNMLFGGNLVGTYGIGDFVLEFLPERTATHNTQLDLLFGIGIVGWVLVTLVGLVALVRTFAVYRETRDGVYAVLFAVKVTVVVFSFSLSSFPSWMMFLFYFLDPSPNARTRR